MDVLINNSESQEVQEVQEDYLERPKIVLKPLTNLNPLVEEFGNLKVKEFHNRDRNVN